MPSDGQAARGLPAQHGVHLVHFGGDILEADRHLIAVLAERLSHPVEHMRGGKIAHHWPLPAAVLVQIIVEHHQDLVGRDVGSVRVDDAEAIAVPVHGNAEIVALA